MGRRSCWRSGWPQAEEDCLNCSWRQRPCGASRCRTGAGQLSPPPHVVAPLPSSFEWVLQANILVKAPFPFVRRPLKDVPICQLFGLSFLCFFSPFPSPCAYSSQATALKSTAMAVSSWTITTPTQVYKGWAADGEPAMVLWPASCGAVMGTKAHCVLQEQAVLHLRLWHQLLDSDNLSF
nr:uncharacterized protein LOC117844891 [Setaria viridis]